MLSRFLYLDLYLLGDDTSISKESFMRPKRQHLFGMVHVRNKCNALYHEEK